MDLGSLVAALGARFAQPELSLDESGRCCFLVDERFQLLIERMLDEKTFILYSAVCKVSPQREDLVLRLAMQANLFGLETGGACLGYDSERSLLILSQRFSESCVTEATFERDLASFLAYLGYWVERLNSQEDAVEGVADIQRHLKDLKDRRFEINLS